MIIAKHLPSISSHVGALSTMVGVGLAIAPVGCTSVDFSESEPSPGSGETVSAVWQEMQVLSKTIKARNGGKCIDLPDGNGADAVQYQTWTCNESNNNQLFHVWDQGGGRHDIRNAASNKCLYIANDSNGAWVEQRACNNGDYKQLWYLDDRGSGEWRIRNAYYPGMCVDLSAGNTANGAKIQAWGCGEHANQRFLIGKYATDFFDGFDGTALDGNNWQDQLLWVNDEAQCYVPNGDYGTRNVTGGVLKMRVINLGYTIGCNNWSKNGTKHPDTKWVAARITSKNRKEFARGRFTARLKLWATNGTPSGQSGMFPAWWLLGYRNNEPPVQEQNEDVCWPLPESGEEDIFEHYGQHGQNRFTARGVKSQGYCNGGDWSTYQSEAYPDLVVYHDYAVEHLGSNLLFTVDGEMIGQHPIGNDYNEPMQMILNYAKINYDDNIPATHKWGMDIDYVKHEYWNSW